ncbi:hypothetical protein QTI27_36800 [Variovorax sp. J31P216]|nr:hypothetical protein [Variovorax sp. J31P216]
MFFNLPASLGTLTADPPCLLQSVHLRVGGRAPAAPAGGRPVRPGSSVRATSSRHVRRTLERLRAVTPEDARAAFDRSSRLRSRWHWWAACRRARGPRRVRRRAISARLKSAPKERANMAEPLTIAVVSTAVVTEGIKFLYGQAAEVIKRWRERRDAVPTVAAEAPPPAVFGDTLQPLQIHLDRVSTLEPQLLSLCRALADVADGPQTLSRDDPLMLQAADALRQAMEAVYQQRLSFVGESRAASAPVVEGVISVNTAWREGRRHRLLAQLSKGR